MCSNFRPLRHIVPLQSGEVSFSSKSDFYGIIRVHESICNFIAYSHKTCYVIPFRHA